MTDSRYIAELQSSVGLAGDESAYKKLFYHFHPLLRRFANNLIGNLEISDEIVSDVLLKVWTMRDKIDQIKDLKLYLFKATRNNCLNYLKSAAHKNSALTDPVSENDGILISPESEYIYTELQQLLLTTVSGLPSKCQSVFRLVKEHGLSYAQVGAVMDISQNTIETHMRLALKRIKLVLDRYRPSEK